MTDLQPYFKQLHIPQPDSHKGQNGKLLIIGGSDLFHAASKWSLDVASCLVDMVFYSSVPSNNELIQKAKENFWNGIVVSRDQIESYIEEADCILIGPGMERQEEVQFTHHTPAELAALTLTQEDWDTNTEKIVNYLLAKYPTKKWVVDAGALQMVQPQLLTSHVIITPHPGELERVLSKLGSSSQQGVSQLLQTGVTVLLKGQTDHVYSAGQDIEIEGGNAGMTKGGTGDVLAGLVAGLYATNEAVPAAVVASAVNKKAGDALYETVGPFFNASDLAKKVPPVLWQLWK